ncbi:MAG: ATP-binding protein [Saprospiraceae bacterium]
MKVDRSDQKTLRILKVRILSVRPARLLVSLPNNQGRGIIPKREWSWDRSINAEKQHFRENQIIEAVLLPSEKTREVPFLSIREKESPWADAARKFVVNQDWEGEVINIRRNAVYVQVEPGIVGVLWAAEIPLLPAQVPEDILVLGDRIIVEIVAIDVESRRMELSMLRPLRRNPTEEELLKELEARFQKRIEALKTGVKLPERAVDSLPRKIVIPVSRLERLSDVLLVENDDTDAMHIARFFKINFDAVTYRVKSIQEALAYLTEHTVDLVVLDINLDNGQKGTVVAEEILAAHPNMPLLFISNDVFADEFINPLEEKLGQQFPFAYKEWQIEVADVRPGSLYRTVKNLQEGIIEKHGSLSRKEAFMSGLEEVHNTSLPIQEKLYHLLESLVVETQIEHALILRLDRDTRVIHLTAAYPAHQTELYEQALDGLYYSPVREVIEDEQVFYLSKLDDKLQHARISNFFRNIPYKSCYGLPLKTDGGTAEYALFILDKRPDLSWDIISRIRLTAAYTSTAIERDQFLNALRPKQDMAMRGELMATFIHEFSNKLEPLFDFIEEARKLQSKGNPQQLWKYMEKVSPDLLKIKELTIAYGRLAKAELQEVNLNQIVEKVHNQLEPLARRSNISLKIKVEPLPLVEAIPMHVEQVLTNVVLNAIQHIDEQAHIRKAINEAHGFDPEALLVSPKMLLIKSCTSVEIGACCIMVMDTGGGVPYDLHRKIFSLGVSTRKGGHGLGLYISRNLVEAMNGRLEWMHSLRGFGSAFALIFPIKNAHNEQEKRN